ncbi:acyl transferase domain-containing protein [Micromonospora sp. Llam0]|uniref:type I polyketide synthase n=1 Tax=Micromonospora sp. Llam0 TaxID=2485143 RepID=UPI000F4A0CE8|nr:type I polyketide synthase [Micromonospora sp. Llam0]ROO62112.1 acyl transferase domain-containing protein [Micromonospora sp. Llam0]
MTTTPNGTTPSAPTPLSRALDTIRKLRAQLEASGDNQPIAVIGVGLRLPGGIDTLDGFWQALAQRRDLIGPLPAARRAPFEREWAQLPQLGGFLDEVLDFDAAFFGISPREARALDPQHRLLLEVCHEALEHSARPAEQLRDTRTGFFVGITHQDYRDWEPHGADAYWATGNGHCFAAGRVAYALGLTGPAVAVDTACSSSLVAIHQASSALRRGECEVALAGGVNLIMSPRSTRLLGPQMGALSPDGRCKAFDARANGFIRGEGCAVLVLKRLDAARRDGDVVHAVLNGSAVNQDGRSSGFTAPNVLAQSALIGAALADARLTPADIGLIETHGTGTALGDPIEMEAVATSLGRPTEADDPLYVGAAKTNVGHLEAAAGVVGVVKAILSLRYDAVPPLVHFSTLNPRIDLAGTRVRMPTGLLPWTGRPGRLRHAGVSSFGMSGTNAHVIVGEPEPAEAPAGPAGSAPGRQPVAGDAVPVTGFEISAGSRPALRELADRYGRRLADLRPEQYAAFAYTATAGRTRHAVRARVTAADPAAAAAALSALADGSDAPTVQVHEGDLPTALPDLPRQVVELPHYPWQRQRYAPPVESGPASSDVASPTAPLYELGWQPIAGRDPDGSTLVLAGDDGELLTALAEVARTDGWPTVVLGPAGLPAATGPLPADGQQWQAFWQRRDPAEKVLVLLAMAAEALPAELPATEPATELAATGDGGLAGAGAALCVAVTTAVRALPGGAPDRRVVVLTRGARRTGADDPVRASTHGLLHGLAPVLGLELPAWGGLVDLPVDTGPTDLLAALRALPGDGEEDLLAVRRGTAATARLRPVPADYAPQLPVDPDGSYLVTGGLGGVGRCLVRDLVRRGARRLLLTGRRAADDIAPAAAELLAELADAGVEVRYRTADCDDPAALTRALADDLPRLRGVVHAAGHLTRTPLAHADRAAFEQTLRGKFTGAWWLHLLLRDHPLDFFLTVSSVSAHWGADGYGGYAAANGGIDMIANHRVSAGLAATSVAFGPWTVDGMVDATDLAELARGGVDPVTAQTGAASLTARTAGSDAVLVCCPVRWDRFAAVMSARRPRALYQDLVTGPAAGGAPYPPAGPASGPADPAGAHAADPPAGTGVAGRERLLAVPELARPAALRDQVGTVVARILGYPDGEQVRQDQGFFDLGLDSMMAVDLVDALAGEYGVPLQVADVFDHPTVSDLAALMLGRVDDSATPPAGGQRQRPAVRSAEPGTPEPTRPPAPAPTPQPADAAAGEPIAIIGMAGRFPGADSIDEFWQLLVDGRDGVGAVPPRRWNGAALHDSDPMSTGTITTDQGGFLSDVDRFDAGFFGIPAREAQSLDPQHRLLLECAWHALEDADVDPAGLAGGRTGVYIGISNSDYARLLQRGGLGQLDAYFGTGTSLNAAAGRIAYLLGLHGPAIAVDTACSSALVALHLAIRSLRSGETDTALVGGVNVIASPEASVAVSRAHMLSPTGRCKTFAADADGFVRSEAAAVVLLKPLSAALRDGDRVLAVVRGSAVNSDGASSGLTAPNGTAQQAVLRAALADAGASGPQVSYLEAHGTGTALGDPVEVRAAWQVLGDGRAPGEPLHLGSVKSNVGHCESASGIVSVVKTVLALRHGRLPANLHCAELNPQIGWAEMNVRVLDEPVRWRSGGRSRLAGVSSFGFSGTNAHVVLAEAPPQEPAGDEPGGPWLLPLSAPDEAGLDRSVTAWDEVLAGSTDADLPALVGSAGAGRVHLPVRRAALGSSVEELRRALARTATPAGADQPATPAGADRATAPRAAGRPPRVAFLFSGQGSQYFGMGAELHRTEPVFRETFDACDEILAPRLGSSLTELMWHGTRPELLDQTWATQPALVALELSLAALWASWGVHASAVIGHSVGEIAAAIHAGVLDLADGLALVARRARLMQDTQPGAMLAVAAEPDQVAEWLDGTTLDVAAINGPRAVVVAGLAEEIADFAADRRTKGVRCQQLVVSHAFHSRLMEPMLPDFGQTLASLPSRPPALPIVANLTGRLAGPDTYLGDYWCRHVRQPVRFHDGIGQLRQLGVDVFLEIGPGRTLAGLVTAGGSAPDGGVVASLRRGAADRATLLDAVRSLYLAGGPVRWAAVQPRRPRPAGQRAARYPFADTRYWTPLADQPPSSSATATVDEPPTGQPPAAATGQQTQSHVGRELRSPALRGRVFEFTRSAAFPAYLTDHRLYGTVVTPAASHLATLVQALAPDGSPVTLTDLVCPRALVITEQERYDVQLTVDRAGGRLAVSSLVDADRDLWQEHLAARLRPTATTTGPAAPDPAVAELPAPDPAADRAAFIASAQRHVTGAQFYAYFRDLGYTLGPSFRWIADIWLGWDEALVRYVQPPLPDDPADYQLYPGLIDSCFQSIAGFLVDEVAEEAPALAIPFAAARLEFPARDRIDGELWGRVRVRDAEPLARGRSRVTAADLRLARPDGTTLLAVDDFRVRHAPRELLRRSLRDDRAGLYTVRWQPADDDGRGPDADPAGAGRRDTTAPTGAALSGGSRSVLLVGPATDFTEALAAELRDLGHAVDVDRSGSASGADLVVDLRFLAVDPTGTDPTGDHPTGDAAGPVPAAVLALGESLRGRSTSTPYVVVCPADDAAAPDREALWGMLAAVEAEESQRRLLRIDLVEPAPAAAARLGRQLDAVLASGVTEPRLRLHADGVEVPRLVAVEPGPVSSWPDGVLITGGLGALGLSVARILADGGTRTITLVGRSAPGADARAAVDELVARGVRVEVVAADIADPAGCATAVAAAGRLGPLRAVLHLAGTTDDGAFATLPQPAYEKVFAGKVGGARNLADAVRGLDLTAFVLFSSVSSVFGSAGQVNYAAANGYLDGLATALRADGVPAVSVNWGPWEPAGGSGLAATEAVRRAAGQLGVRALTDAEAAPLLAAALGARRTRLVAVAVDLARYAGRAAGHPRTALVRELVADVSGTVHDRSAGGPPMDRPVEAGRPAGWLRGLLLGLAGPDRQDRLRSAIAELVGETIGDTGRIDDNRGFAELGLDSIMAIDLRARLSHALDVELPATAALDHPTVRAMTAFVDSLLPAADQPGGAPEPAEPAEPARPRSAEPAEPAWPASAVDTADLASLSLDDLIEAARADLAAGP